MKGVQCYELFGGIAHKNHAFSFSFYLIKCKKCDSVNYIGRTSTFFILRMNNHKNSIRDNNKGLQVARHFNKPGHQSVTLNVLY